jgi:hypothetical protein
MRLLTRRKTPTEELKEAAIEALVNALDDDKRAAKPGSKGVRAVAAGAVIYTAGRAAFKGQRFVREQLSSDTEDDQAEDVEDEEETRAYEEPEAEEYEVDEEEDEPEAYEEDDEPEAFEEDEEPEASEEDEYEPEAVEEDEYEPEAYDEDEEEPETRREPDDDSRSKTPTPFPERKPMRRAARRKSAQPSLKLPAQRRPRTRLSRD